MAKRRKKKKKGFGSGELEHNQRGAGALADAVTMVGAARKHLDQGSCIQAFRDLNDGAASVGNAKGHLNGAGWNNPMLRVRYDKVERRLSDLNREFTNVCLKKR